MSEEVQECIQGNGLAKKMWANEKTAGSRQETTEMQHEVKVGGGEGQNKCA